MLCEYGDGWRYKKEVTNVSFPNIIVVDKPSPLAIPARPKLSQGKSPIVMYTGIVVLSSRSFAAIDRITPTHKSGLNLASLASWLLSAHYHPGTSTIPGFEPRRTILVRPENNTSSCLSGCETSPLQTDLPYTRSRRHSWQRSLLSVWALLARPSPC